MRSREEERRFTFEDIHQPDDICQYEDIHKGDIYLQDIHHHGWDVSQPRSRKRNIISEPVVAVVEEVEESDSDEETILAYKELYQLNTAVTKHTTATTTTTTATYHHNIDQNIAEQEVEGKPKRWFKLLFIFFVQGGAGRFDYLERVLARRHTVQCAGCGENITPGRVETSHWSTDIQLLCSDWWNTTMLQVYAITTNFSHWQSE